MSKFADEYNADNFRENLRELVWERELMQKDVAEMMGIPCSTVNNWLKGRSEPNLFYFAKLCNELNVPPEWFLHKNRFVDFES